MKCLLLPIICALGLVGCSGPPSTPNQNSTQSTKEAAVERSAPIIKVYVENSGSMYGYVKGTTDFENAVYSYLSDLQLAELGKKDSSSYKNTMELNYINSEVLKQNPDIQDFIKKLEPKTFKLKGGNMGASDMSDIIGTIFSQIETNTDIAIFVSDCIFSPGRTYQARDNADEYLVSQQIGIKNHTTKKIIENGKFAIVVMRLMSQFNGFYYNKFDDRASINNNRPFYIWLMGDRAQLKRVVDKVDIAQIKGSGVQNIFMASKPNGGLMYGIQYSQKIGTYNPDSSNSKTTITGVSGDCPWQGQPNTVAIRYMKNGRSDTPLSIERNPFILAFKDSADAFV